MSDKNILDNKKIAFFEPHKDFATNPTLLSLSDKLLDLGANIDVFCPKFRSAPRLTPKIRQHPFPYAFSLWENGVLKTLQNWKKFFLNSSWRSASAFEKNDYDLLIGIDSEGLIASWHYARKRGLPLIYISFEIFFKDELKDIRDHQEKDEEIFASQFADLIIIPDRWRAHLLARENIISEEKFIYLPVAPQDSKIRKSNYLRNKYNIPKDKTIVLHSGSFEEWTCSREIIEELADWPPNIVLIIHTKYSPFLTNPDIRLLKGKKYKNVILSIEPLANIEYEDMVASADIGLVLYKPISHSKHSKYHQKNIQTIGLSSGKFSYYMKFGLPVITLNQDSYAELLKHYDFGYNIYNLRDIPNAINKILLNYNSHRDSALRLFNEKLKFDLHWPALFKKITCILQQHH